MYIDTGTQLLREVKVNSDVDYTLRGSAASSLFLGPIEKTLDFLFANVESGFIEVSLYIDPFDPISFKWTQVVPSDDSFTENSLSIGTQYGVSNIISNGYLLSNYSQIMIPSEIYSTPFYISHKSPLMIGNPIITTSHEILQPEIIYDSKYIGNIPSMFKLNYRCINDGKAEVKITIPYRNTHSEFSIIKVCKRPRIRIQKESFSNSNILLIGGLFSMMALLGCLWMNREKSIRSLIR